MQLAVPSPWVSSCSEHEGRMLCCLCGAQSTSEVQASDFGDALSAGGNSRIFQPHSSFHSYEDSYKSHYIQWCVANFSCASTALPSDFVCVSRAELLHISAGTTKGKIGASRQSGSTREFQGLCSGSFIAILKRGREICN